MKMKRISRAGKQRGPTFTFVDNLHLKGNQALSLGHISNCGASADNNCHTDL